MDSVYDKWKGFWTKETAAVGQIWENCGMNRQTEAGIWM